jgi:hypothetical protein
MALVIKKITIGNIVLEDLTFSKVEDVVTFLKLLKEGEPINEEIQTNTLGNILPIETPTIDEIINKLKTETQLSESSLKTYSSFLRRVDIDLFDASKIVEMILGKYTNKSTINIYLSALLMVYKLYKRQDLYDIVYKEFVLNKENIDKEKNEKVIESKPIEEAKDLMEDLKVKYNELKTELTNDYNVSRQMCAIGCLYFNHGVIRGDELTEMWINENENCEHDNYIDIENKKMIIRKHKSMKSMGTRTIDLCDEFMDLVKDYPNRLFVTTIGGKSYTDATGLTKKIKKSFGNGIYDYRIAKSSINLQGVDTELATNQGHSISTQAKFYRKYK